MMSKILDSDIHDFYLDQDLIYPSLIVYYINSIVCYTITYVDYILIVFFVKL